MSEYVAGSRRCVDRCGPPPDCNLNAFRSPCICTTPSTPATPVEPPAPPPTE